MTINEAIKKAQENGLMPREITLGESWKAQVLLMPEFWQALGKALGWEQVCNVCGEECDLCEGWSTLTKKYLYEWHKLIDYLDDNGTIESYFEQLTKH